MNFRSIKKTKQYANNGEHFSVTTGSLKVFPSNHQEIGSRERQEDAFAFSDLANKRLVLNRGLLAVVADGMGGLACGERASQAAVNAFLREYNNKNDCEPEGEFLQRAITVSNTAVYDLAYTGGEEIDLGTTLAAIMIHQNQLHWVSVGDSRIYLYRHGLMSQLSTDHIYANHLAAQVACGHLSRKEAEEHPERNFLTSYLGLPALTEIDRCSDPVHLESGDAVMLCSDGLYNSLPVDEIISVLKYSPVNAAEVIGKKAISKSIPYQDNITLVILTCQAL
ncbi:MAG TPA: protein phosphatase 2C domain-containing protein [Candidatus Limnocylindrales bacterium]|nr:protein phosphatase 2C domain-containing protein [Candidatus Limnocylindrales bacterium]